MIISVRVHPKAKNARIIKQSDGVYDVYAPAPPQDNKANQATLRLLADHFNLPISLMSIRRGNTSRVKTIQIEGNITNDSA